MNAHVKWEYAEGGLERIVVPGGWIYREQHNGALCFVPHPHFLAGGRGAALPRLLEQEPPPPRAARSA